MRSSTLVAAASVALSVGTCVLAPAEAVAEPSRKAASGLASWYGPGFHGRRTASGERFNAGALTAAHRTLPFGTRVLVTNRRTGKTVQVRINDRGPFSRGRIIDLSRSAARQIGISGTAPVTIQVAAATNAAAGDS